MRSRKSASTASSSRRRKCASGRAVTRRVRRGRGRGRRAIQSGG